ncbi:Lrp/AsnC family transcriptional regulator [Croceicoccus ponticola]|uniref:Lrp/AsnC family transcriptional regulator n=1 Tax=Croceicoccus ponticola TaxID=2217664 RepID=A0A437GW77_9SPHN|nr:Lrp/AsnC family transcriptional regulator [Croceicoccus ponticola]RVQ66390.1 Lrp/AsnC family transcriptional regulator [Croceicoccus ponticola]
MQSRFALDRIDFKILDHLQKMGRCSNVELAEMVGLSPSPCLSRVKRLQQAGVIEGFGAHVALARLGDYLIVFSEVTIDAHRRQHLRRFEKAAAAVPEIMECYNVSGGYDFLLRIVARSVSHFQEVMEGLLVADLGIRKFQSYVVLRVPFVKHELPLDRLFRESTVAVAEEPGEA